MNETSPNIFEGLPAEPLSALDEARLAVQIQQRHHPDDINALVLSAMREAILYAGRCARGRIPEGDLFSLAYAALMKAAPRFRPGMIRFLAYAKPDIRGEISRMWKNTDVVKNSSLHESEVPDKVIRNVSGGGGRDTEQTLIEEDETTIEENYAEPEFDRINMNERWALVRPLMLKNLNERERTVLQFVYESGFNFEEISSMLVPKVCREAVRMTHERALRKLRNALLRGKQLYSTI